ncbi:SPFH domain-containing protein [Lactococcus lactis]|uniref:Regulator of protease activity HflC (Stomatin/prohibitin superfamily) n=1 Tax=Lactococcus lactis TaxID=1358 RepID=A0AAW5TN44_9LACT|nr:SPFH domain-containing protein [Lactococcus lactis]MCW2281406.1 regulator of protease activity HflC (stomatin/prohibitin superfamily) [Lactococcus lactis]MCW2281454.1 regulator of protease activity HflC (stomatin/prohibitin superfamily) [Lactococcus lactis]
MNNKQIKAAIIAGAVVLVGAVVTLTSVEKVENGYNGVQISKTGKIVSEKSLKAGYHWAFFSNILEYPTKMKQIDYNASGKEDSSIVVSTSDGKRVNIEVKLAYHVDPDKIVEIYKKFGNVTDEGMEKGWLRTQTQNALRDEYVKHSILDILTGKAETLESDVLKNVKERFSSQGYVLDDVTLGVPDVDSDTQKTIDGIIAATQANEKAKKDAETAITNAKKDADVAKTKADADLYAAQKQAEANKKLSESITDELVKYKEAEAHLKHGFVTVQGADSTIVDESGKQK